MRKISVSIQYGEERLEALNHYMEQKDCSVKDELAKFMDTLYAKYVPSNVREYIDIRDMQKSKRDTKRVHITQPKNTDGDTP